MKCRNARLVLSRMYRGSAQLVLGLRTEQSQTLSEERRHANFEAGRILFFVAVRNRLDQSSSAQSTTGTVVGTITDPTGSVIVHANATLVNNANGSKMTAPVSDSGDYQFLT